VSIAIETLSANSTGARVAHPRLFHASPPQPGLLDDVLGAGRGRRQISAIVPGNHMPYFVSLL
jgi:hypothetical protein